MMSADAYHVITAISLANDHAASLSGANCPPVVHARLITSKQGQRINGTLVLGFYCLSNPSNRCHALTFSQFTRNHVSFPLQSFFAVKHLLWPTHAPTKAFRTRATSVDTKIKAWRFKGCLCLDESREITVGTVDGLVPLLVFGMPWRAPSCDGIWPFWLNPWKHSSKFPVAWLGEPDHRTDENISKDTV